MKIIVLFLMMALAQVSAAQSVISLEECYRLAGENYPLVRQRSLIEATESYSIENISKTKLPQFDIGGQASYQSDVTRVPVEMPGIEPLSKDQYRLFAELSQTLLYGGIHGERRRNEQAKALVEKGELEVELYQVKSRINDLYFGVLLLEEQIRQTNILKKDVFIALTKTEASVGNGILLPSAGDVLRSELLQVEQRIIELQSGAETYRAVLASFINRAIDSTTVFEKPVFVSPSDEIARPEVGLFAAQTALVDVNESMMVAGLRPRVDLFAQAGYGRPALNMLENEFDAYFLGGIRFRWQLSGYYTLRKQKQMFDLRKRSLDLKRETFFFNTRLSARQQQSEITRLRNTIALDDEIILLRTSIRQSASAQLDAGVITAADFVREVNAEDRARQNRALHEVQLLLAQSRLHFTIGQ